MPQAAGPYGALTPELPLVHTPAPQAAARPPGPRAAVIAAWLLSFVVLGGASYGAVAWRHPIEEAWPAAGRAYVLLGYR